MPPFIRFVIYRLLSIPVTLVIITSVMYGFVMLTPPDVRASLYFPPRMSPYMTEERLKAFTQLIIERHHLDDPYWVQYGHWLLKMVRGDWGWSPALDEEVLPALLRRTPITAELAFYSLLLIIPLGLVSGTLAGQRAHQPFDRNFRLTAFIATSLPPFILALVLMSIFYVGLRWFPPERLSLRYTFDIRSPDFRFFTGFLTIDGLLNHRPDISLDAARHLVLPVITLSLAHWATLGRVMRAVIIEELQKEYVIAGRARGVPERKIVWKHAFRNALPPALTSSMLSAASLFTGVFTVEVIFNYRGISDVAVSGLSGVPDSSPIMGFAIYSVLTVLCFMLLLDLIQAAVDPRVRLGLLGEEER